MRRADGDRKLRAGFRFCGGKAWIGVENPHRADVLTELRRSTAARVCTGRAGPRPRTQALLRFLADHSRSKDTVLKEVPEEWVKAQGLLEVRSEISDKTCT